MKVKFLKFTINPKCECYAIGVILDGKADKFIGDKTRGARYNSALKYIHSFEKQKCVILVVSEDETIDKEELNKKYTL